MRWLALFAVMLSPSASAERPARVMSLSLCTDALLLDLAPPSRITSVTRLAREAAGARVAAAASRVAVNRQSAEEVLRQRPDIVLTGAFTAPATLAMLRRLGVRVVEVPPATSLADIRRITRQVGAAVGAPARAEALVRRMDATLARIAADPLPYRPRVAAWDGTGRLPPRGSLYDAVLTAAGARNIGREPGVAAGGFHVEALLAAAPDFLVHETRLAAATGRRGDRTGHPLVRRYRDRWVAIDQDAFVCGTPGSVDAAWRLNRDLARRIAARRGR